ncbi:MAG TPA: hypothetical protein VGS41_14045, partial [Chthonomonadales bacterium]|nr:hypothetical protein [Chthonomonadales bacterium]
MPSVISPSAFMTGNAPGGANYAAPLLDFSPLARLPQDYYAGTQMARQQALQNAFPQGLPRLPNGQIDTNQVMDTLTRLGGAEAAQAIMPTLINQQIGNQAAGLLAPGGTAGVGPAAGPAAGSTSPVSPSYGGARAGSGPNAGPANIVGNQPQQAQEGQNSIRSLATEIFGGRDVTGLINSYSRQSGIAPDAPLTPQQAQQFSSFAGRFKLAAGQGTQAPRPQQRQTPD